MGPFLMIFGIAVFPMAWSRHGKTQKFFDTWEIKEKGSKTQGNKEKRKECKKHPIVRSTLVELSLKNS